MPEVDCYTHLNAWLDHLEILRTSTLFSNDYIFPAIASTDALKFGEHITRTAFEKLLESVVSLSKVREGRKGKFTTHCFRRGGAQFRFMWAPRKWSLKAVKWWGGWSSGDSAGASSCLSADTDMTTGWDNYAISTG